MKVRARMKWKITYKGVFGFCVSRWTNKNKGRSNNLWIECGFVGLNK